MSAKVLLVDDEEQVRYAFVLAHEDYLDIITADGADAALKLLKPGNTVGVVVTDIKMPKMDGIELSKIIKRQCPEKRIIIHTANPAFYTNSGGADGLNVDGSIDKIDPAPDAVTRARKMIETCLREYESNDC